MGIWEHLQFSINYYPIEAGTIGISDQDVSDVWKGLEGYLGALRKQGWIMVNETQTDKG